MIDDMEAKWDEYEVMGVKKVSQLLAQSVLGEVGEKVAKGWLIFKANETNIASNKAQAKMAKAALIISGISILISAITLLKLLNYI